jgi:hypothetical protein
MSNAAGIMVSRFGAQASPDSCLYTYTRYQGLSTDGREKALSSMIGRTKPRRNRLELRIMGTTWHCGGADRTKSVFRDWGVQMRLPTTWVEREAIQAPRCVVKLWV